MDLLPTVAIVSSSNTKPTSLIKLITKNTDVCEDLSKNGIITEPWNIDTKYYTAKVNLSALHQSYQRTKDFNENIEALILLFDSNKSTGLSDLKIWEPIEEDCNADVKLLVTNYCTSETKISKANALEWCLNKGFELVELYLIQPVSNKEEDEDIIKETQGIDRIIEALETHLWSNMDMKPRENANRIEPKPNSKKDQNQEKTKPEEVSVSSDGESDIDRVLNKFLADDDNSDFSNLFAQLHMMKQSVQSLPIAERRQGAEQVVSAFWNAIGGDDDEVADI